MHTQFGQAKAAIPPGKTAIQVRQLRKVFTSYFDRPGTLKETILRLGRAKAAQVVALNGISFDVSFGESVAIIGPNGSGKTTLLAILAGVYKPTSGECVVRGKVVAMLGVAGGFHPELTVLDNLLFVGVTMGMSISEVNEKLESILDFAELDRVLNAPIRTLSTGMCIRLGFSLGIHASPQILLIDEQLQATDEHFQSKALSKLRELNENGVTLIFVTHYLPWVQTLASRVIWLEHGVIRMDGVPRDVVDAYLKASHSLMGA
ncbi:MAG: ATP-binding cassette domain-containing protein [Armatimonadota bacterium]|nr:ATP-binding cassette domain-containing protein [Armatimonadota bacterium]MCX7776533.1 ATP-binding cassette domain-containing protein [Armatimonadota bacterium]MDW8024332.1 ATP-binding cassette domain-containing protein [Armatimonadota bacterium]